MTTSDIRIMTYNMGSSIKDYELPHLVNNPTTPEVRSKEFPEKYRMAQTKTASLADQAEIFCLQEVGNWNERPLIQELQRRKFTFLPKLPAPGEALDAVIRLLA